jgi:hypothetical protein
VNGLFIERPDMTRRIDNSDAKTRQAGEHQSPEEFFRLTPNCGEVGRQGKDSLLSD